MISILLATYNGEKYIKKSIDSILNQTFTHFELLIGFNGTTDNSRSIVAEYNDSRIKVFDYGEDKGKAKTLNKLLNEAKFDLICLQDDDDIWISTKLEEQLPFMIHYDVVGTMVKYIDEHDNITGKPNLSNRHDDIVYLSMNGINQVANTSAMFKRKDCYIVGGWAKNLDGIEDYDFWLKLMRSGKKFINLNEDLVLHRVHSDSNFNTKTYDLFKIIK